MDTLEKLARLNHPQLTCDKSVTDASILMRDENIGAIIIVEGFKVVGIFSERDVMNRVVAKGLNPDETKFDSVMTTNLITVPIETRATVAIELMNRRRIRHLPVTKKNRVVGVVNMRTLLGHVIRNLATINKDLQNELDQLRFFGMTENGISQAS